MNTGLPFRAPAGGWSRKTFVGGCYQHWRAGEAAQPVLRNLTRVANFTGLSPATIPPYPRQDSYSVSQDGPNRNCGHDSLAPCGPWTPADFASACGEGQARYDVDCYQTLEEVFNGALCQKVGFKAIQARKTWHGEFAYRDPDRPQNYGRCPAPSAPSGVKYLSKTFNIHLHGTYIVTSLADKVGGGTETWVDTATYDVDVVQTWTIDPLSGVMSVAGGCTAGPSVMTFKRSVDGGDPVDVSPFGSFPIANDNWLGAFSSMALFCDNTVGMSGSHGGAHFDGGTPDVLAAEFHGIWPDIDETIVYPPYVPTVPPDPPIGVVWAPGGATIRHTETLGTDSVTTTDTGFAIELGQERSYTTTFGAPLPSKPYMVSWSGSNSASVSYQQGDAYLATTVISQVKDLLALWNLSDDKLYPWRQDRWTTVNPLLSYDEYPGAQTLPDGPGACDYADTSGHTGEILGKPITGGHPEMRLDAETVIDNFTDYTGGEVWHLTYPPSAISSVDRYGYDVGTDSTVLKFHGVLGADYTQDLVAGTVTETGGNLLNSASSAPYDYVRITYTTQAMAGGHFDYRHVNPRWFDDSGTWRFDLRMFGAYSGGGFGPDPTDNVQPWNATQWTGCTDGQNQDGKAFPHGAFFISDANGATGQKYAEIKLPLHSQNWFGPCGADRDVMVGQSCADETCAPTGGAHRWPDAWPIEGDRFVVGATAAAGVVTITMDRAADYLRAGDSVEFTGDDAAVVGTAKTVTAVGAGTFTYTGTVPDLAVVKRVRSAGAPAWWWYDTDGKGDCLSIQHTRDFRSVSVEIDPGGTVRATQLSAYGMPRDVAAYTVSQWGVKFVPCLPAVLCYSPNYDVDDPDSIDSFGNGITLGFPELSVDARFGWRWQGVFLQAVQDLWYVTPRQPCGGPDSLTGVCTNICAWVPDDGNGLSEDLCDPVDAGGTQYYAALTNG